MAETCPEPDRLREVLAGTLPTAQSDAISRHVEGCEACQKALEELARSSWEERARQVRPMEVPESALQEVMQQALGPKGPLPATIPEIQPEPTSGREDGLGFLSPSDKPGHLGRLGHYEILALIGKGGFGTVFKARDETLDRVVAIKVLTPPLANNGTARKRFKREAKAAAAISHDHVVGIHAVDESNGVPYIVMQLIHGISLQDRLDRSGPLELQEVLRVGMQIAAGLAAAHAQGLVHRDIKPANILLENGVERVKISDFGLARAVDDASVSQSGVVAGTPMYMAPEQAAGEMVDHRADLFSLGSVLYLMCTGRAPFRASGTMAVMKRVIEETPRPIRELNPEIPEWLEAVIAKLHSKKPVDRFQTAKEVAELLEQHLAHLQHPSKVPQPPVEKLARVDVPARPVLDVAHSRRFVVGCAWGGAGLCLLWLAGTLATASVWDLRTTLFAGIGFFGSLAFALLGLSAVARRLARPTWSLRLGQAAIFCGVLAIASSAAAFVIYALGFTFTYVVTLETDDPDTVVRIWPTAQTEPPANLAGPFQILGKPAHVIPNVATKEISLPAGNYWVAAELDGQEVHRVFLKLQADSFHVNYQEKFGPLTSWVGRETRGLPRILAIPGVANLVQKEKAKLQGTWRVVAAETDGKPMPREMIEQQKSRLVFAGDRLTQLKEGDAPKATGYTVHPRKKPAAIDVPDFFPGGKKGLAIYRWEKDDTLRVCSSPRERPTDFTTAPGSERILFTLRRDSEGLAKTAQPGWVQLFNGKDLTGWESGDHLWRTRPTLQKIDPETWSVAAGEIVGKGRKFSLPKGRGFSLLTTARHDYADFHLRAEVKVNDKNSGIWFRLKDDKLAGYEAQINSKHLTTKTGSLLRLTQSGSTALVMVAKSQVPADTWFTLEIIANGPKLMVKINGETTAEANDLTFQSGPIGLEVHHDTVVHFRRIEIRELPPTRPGVALQPFVILARDAKSERRFATLAEAVAAAQSGDTIEIRGNGPFVSPPISITDTPVTVRAAGGFRPVLKLADQAADSDAPLLYTNSALVLEGLEFHRVGQKPWQPGTPLRCVIWSMKAPLRIANCLFHLKGGTVCIYSDKGARFCEVRNCAFFSVDAAVTWWAASGGQFIMENCLSPGYHAVSLPYRGPLKDVSITLKRNTFVPVAVVHLALVNAGPKEKTEAAVRPIRLDTLENVLGGETLLRFEQTQEFLSSHRELRGDETESLLRRLVDWQDRENLYALPRQSYLMLTSPNFEPVHKVRSLTGWRNFWGQAHVKSTQQLVRHRVPDLRARAQFSLDKLTPDDFRLAEGSPGKGAGPGGKDLGADVDLVGPGLAYENWKKTPEYQEWLKRTGQVQPTAEPNPFVILGKDAKAEWKFANLAEAVAAAQSGDIIEIRGNGPFVTKPISLQKKALTVRSAPGAAPILRLGANAADESGPLFETEAPLVLEGLTLEQGGQSSPKPERRALVLAWRAAVYAANCRFTAGKFWSGIMLCETPRCHLRNCEFLGPDLHVSVGWDCPTEGRLFLDNCTALAKFHGLLIHQRRPVDKNVTLRLRRCTLAADMPINFWCSAPLPDLLGRLGRKEARPFHIEVEKTVFDPYWNVLDFRQIDQEQALSLKAAQAAVPQVIAWRGTRNLYPASNRFLFLSAVKNGLESKPFAATPDLRKLSDWLRLWGHTESGSVEGRISFQGGNLAAKARSAVNQLQPVDFRLHTESAGKAVGDVDLGAQVDLVGPGAAYERWKKTSDYQDWLKKDRDSE
jgi:uncharacterized protein (TIGR03067 family)